MNGALSRGLEGFLAAWAALARGAPGGAWAQIDGWAVAATGGPAVINNQAFLVRACRDPAGALREVISLFDGRGLPYLLQCREDVDPVSEQAAEAAGLSQVGDVPFLLLDPLEPSMLSDEVAGLEIREVRSRADLDVHVGVQCEGFRLPVEAARPFAPTSLLGRPFIRHFTGFAGADAVATSVVHLHEGAAGVFSVATLPAFRRKGYGEAMTARALRWAAEQGCSLAYLQASAMGLPIYERMGFEAAGLNRMYARPDLVD